MNPDVAGVLFLITALAVMMLAELAAGAVGLVLPLTAAVVLYAAQTRSRRTVLVLAFIGGAALDLVYARPLPVSVPALLLGGLVAVQSRPREVAEWVDLLVPIAGGMAAYQGVLLLAAWLHGGFRLERFFFACGVTIWGTVLALLLLALFDDLQEGLGLTAVIPRRKPAPRPEPAAEPRERP